MPTTHQPTSTDLTVVDESAATDTLTQASAGSLGVLPLEHIHPHPKNVRRVAVADDELVESVRHQGLIQPLVVRPAPDRSPADTQTPYYELLAGHRRLDALRQIGADHATCVIRHDLTDEADQIVLMLGENDARHDLTPTEQATGYDLLAELGWSDTRIGKATGHATATVKARRKLTTLTEKARAQIDTGSITLDQGVALAALPEAEQAKVLKSPNFSYSLRTALDRAEKEAAVDVRCADLDAADVPHQVLPAGTSPWVLNAAEHGMTRVSRTGFPDENSHPGCLGYVVAPADQYRAREVLLVCTDVPSHDADLSEQQRARKDEEAAREAERERTVAEAAQKAKAQSIAHELRIGDVLTALKVKPLDPVHEAVMRLWLPTALALVGYPRDVLAAVDLDATDAKADPDIITRLTTPQLVKLFVAMAATDIEADISSHTTSWSTTPSQAARGWFALLDSIGHDTNPIDVALRAAALHEDQDDNAEGDA